jgi:hypothetical protein
MMTGGGAGRPFVNLCSSVYIPYYFYLSLEISVALSRLLQVLHQRGDRLALAMHASWPDRRCGCPDMVSQQIPTVLHTYETCNGSVLPRGLPAVAHTCDRLRQCISRRIEFRWTSACVELHISSGGLERKTHPALLTPAGRIKVRG